MIIFEKDNMLVMFHNANRANLPIDYEVIAALKELNFTQCCENLEAIKKNKLRLFIFHESSYARFLANYVLDDIFIKLQMSSEGRPDVPTIVTEFRRITLHYHIQGGKDNHRLPANKDQWCKLIDWLLKIELTELNETISAPLPDDREIRKFICPEPYPDALVAWYLAEVAKQLDPAISINLSEGIKKEAQNYFKTLCAAHGLNKSFDTSSIKALFEKIAKI